MPYLLVPSDPMCKMKKVQICLYFPGEPIQQILEKHLVYQELEKVLIIGGLHEAHQKLQ